MEKKGTPLSFLLPPMALSQGFISYETSFLSQESPRSLAESGKGTVQSLEGSAEWSYSFKRVGSLISWEERWPVPCLGSTNQAAGQDTRERGPPASLKVTAVNSTLLS